MVATVEQGCVGRFSPQVINDRWRGIRSMERSPAPSAVVVDGPLASEVAMSAHPDDLLDQVLHDSGKCSCFGH